MNKEKWVERFKKREYMFTEEERSFAKGWTCCAVGSRIQLEKPELINDMSDGLVNMNTLLTPRARKLGQEFYNYVKEDKIKQAEKTFYKIQNLKTIFREPNKHYYWWSKFI